MFLYLSANISILVNLVPLNFLCRLSANKDIQVLLALL